jgi:copper chaperone
MKKKINIEGMSCNHCVMHVKNALSEVEGVKLVEVNLQGKYAIVEFEGTTDEALKFAVEDAGYEVISIEEA